jgi:hypothetical protein
MPRGEAFAESFAKERSAQLVGHNLARHFGTGGEHALEKSLGRSLVATLLQQDIFGTVLINCAPQLVGLAAQCHKYFVGMPGRSGLMMSGLKAMREALTEFVSLAQSRFVTDNHTALEQ